jgi:hypothetical protein
MNLKKIERMEEILPGDLVYLNISREHHSWIPGIYVVKRIMLGTFYVNAVVFDRNCLNNCSVKQEKDSLPFWLLLEKYRFAQLYKIQMED